MSDLSYYVRYVVYARRDGFVMIVGDMPYYGAYNPYVGCPFYADMSYYVGYDRMTDLSGFALI